MMNYITKKLKSSEFTLFLISSLSTSDSTTPTENIKSDDESIISRETSKQTNKQRTRK